MPLYNGPTADITTLHRTSSLGRAIRPSPHLESSLPSDLLLRTRGVSFESFEPFPIIKSGEFFETERGDYVVVKTKVNGEERDITTVDVGGAGRLVIGVPLTDASREAAQQAVTENHKESEVTTTAPGVFTSNPLSQEQLAAGSIEVVEVTSNTAVVEQTDVEYFVTDPTVAAAEAAAASALLDHQLLARSAESRMANTVLTSPTGQTYNSPSQSLIQQGITPGGAGSGPQQTTNTKTGGGLKQQSQQLAPQTDPELILLMQMGLL